MELAIFRVVQEALSNVRRHARTATHIHVSLEITATEAIAVVKDDGAGFSPLEVRTLVQAGHLGLAGMYERARLFNGEIAIDSSPGQGTRVTLRLPVESGAPADLQEPVAQTSA